MSITSRASHSPATRWCSLLLLAGSLAFAAESVPAATGPATDKDEDDILKPAGPAKPDPAVERFWAAIRLLQSKKPADVTAGRAALQAVSDHEYTHAQVLLGNCLLSGSYGFPKEERKATNLFRLAAERGNAFAKVSLGSCYATGTGVWKDDDKAAEWLTAALATGADFSQPPRPAAEAEPAEAGSGVAGELGYDPVSQSQATAHFLLGQILSRKGKAADSQSHMIAAATAGGDGRNGIYAAATQAALNYAFGQGVPRDLAKANEMLDLSRQLIARQQISLIHNYVSLKMVDEFAVADLEEKAGEAGSGLQSNLQLSIASMLGDKKSKDYNVAEAVKWYELAADSGQAWAMVQLGLIHANGDLGKKDPVAAFGWFAKAGGDDKPKHYLGVANLAICYQNGLGTARDATKAAELFRKHREHDIVCHLGTIGQCPTAVVTYEEETQLNQDWAKKGEPHAQYLLGIRYLNGWGVKADADDGRKWLEKAGKAKHGAALCQLGLMAENTFINVQGLPAYQGMQLTSLENLKKAADYYRAGSEAGNADATANLASCLYNGRGVTKDLAKAEATYLKCLELDPQHARAHCNLAVLYESKLRDVIQTTDVESIARYRGLMLKHYEESVRLEFAFAANNLGAIYLEGLLLPKDFRKAYQLFELAATHGMPAVHHRLGLMHELGEGVPVTYSEAAYHYRLAALEGHQDALMRLINFYLTGRGVSLDLDRAVFWLTRMVQLGNFAVLPTVCDILINKGDYATVVPILRKLTDSPNDALAGFAYDRLATCYSEGRGVIANPARAKKYSDQAIKRGNGDALTQQAMQQFNEGRNQEAVATLLRAAPTSRQACFFLGQLYYFGTNVEKDETKGVQFMQAAAAKNHSEALFFLAAMTYNRAKGAPTLDQAIQLAQQAENVGNAKATLLREKLEQRRQESTKTPEEAARARTL